MERYRVKKVWVDDEGINVMTENNLTARYEFSQWERLAKATKEEREDFSLSYGGIHWPQIDEDLSFEGMFANAGLCSRSNTEDSVYWTA